MTTRSSRTSRLGLGAEGGPERRDERHRDTPQLDTSELHRSLLTTYQPDRSNPSIRPPLAEQRLERLAHGDPPARGELRVVGPERPDVARDGDQHRRPVQVARLRLAVVGDTEPDRGAGGELVGDDRRRVAATAGRDHLRGAQSPAHQQPVGVVVAVDGVEHRAVEVREVLVRVRAELDDVEVRVAADQRVEGPGDLGDAAAQRPGPLVQLEGEPDVAAVQAGVDSGDVAVQGVLGRRVEEADAGADHPTAVERPAHVVAGLGEGAQQLDGHGRVGVAAPDRGEQPHHVLELEELGDLAHGDSGGEGCGLGGLRRLVRLRADQGQPCRGVHVEASGVRHGRWAPVVSRAGVGSASRSATSAASRAVRPGSASTRTCSSAP